MRSEKNRGERGRGCSVTVLIRKGSIFLSLFVIQIVCPGKSHAGRWKSVRCRSGDK